MEMHGQSFRGHISGAGGINVSGPFKKGPKNKAKEDKHDAKTAIRKEIGAIENSPHLSEEQKQRLIEDLKKAIKKLNKPKGARAKRYNDAVSILKAAHSTRMEAKKSGEKIKAVNGGKVQKRPQVSELKGEDQKTGEEGQSDAFKNFDPARFANQMLDDPQAAMEKLDEMDMQEASLAMSSAQQHIQKVQRMAQLQSSLASASHQTNSSIIRNIG